MKKAIALFSALILFFTASIAQKVVKDANAVARNAKGFHAIEISNGIDLYLTQGNEEAIAVSAAKEEDRGKIVTKVEDGVLKIYYERSSGNWGINWGNRKMKAYVSAKTIDKLSASGGADVYVEGELKSEKISASLSGGSDFKGKVNVQELTLFASGGSDAAISGHAGRIKIHASGGSDIHGYDLVSDYCSVESSGGSDVYITANKEISANASGGSDVHYKGSATATSSKSGGASIKKVS